LTSLSISAALVRRRRTMAPAIGSALESTTQKPTFRALS
jgi:hypothetical protein